jgi:tetratricopeptide (TPR) repeat protein
MKRYSQYRPWGLPLVAAMALTAIMSPAFLAAQEGLGRGRVSGDVRDESGAGIEGVLINAQIQGGDAQFESKTDKKGHFAIAGLGTGAWRFTASKEGFVTAVMNQAIHQLRANEPVEIVLKKASGVEALKSDTIGLEAIDKGNALAAEGRIDEAIAAFDGFLAKYPDVYQVRLNVATAYMKKGDTARAETEYGIVLEKSLPADPAAKTDNASAIRALSGLGEMALKNGDFEKARQHLARALQISPEDEAAAYNVGEIFFSNQKNDEAIQYFELAIKIENTWPKPYYRLGLVYLNKGDYSKAVEYLNKFVELDPQNPEAPNVKNIISTLEKMKK